MTNEEKTEVMETTQEETSEKKALPWWKNRRAQYGMIAGACALVIAGGAGIAIASNQPAPAEEQAQTPTKVEQVEQATTHDLKVTLDLPEWTDTSTPALLEVNDGIDTSYKAVDSTSPSASLTLENGSYTLTLVSPINADGSIYIVSDPQTVKVDNTTGANITSPITGTKLPAEDVTEEQINAIKDAFNKAKDTGKVDQTTVDKVTNNANAGTDARNSKTDEEKQQAQETAKQETTQKQEATAPQNSNNGQSSAGSTSTPASDTSSSTPAHTHSWTPVYKTVHHDAVTHEEPVYETKTSSQTVCTKHNQAFTGDFCSLGNDYGTGHCLANWTRVYNNEQVKTGSKTVTDKAAYDEQVISGYTCSCGATK